MTRPGFVNRVALHRHARHALSDFETLRQGMAEDRFWPHQIEERMHVILHHLRHAVYRSGLESNWHVRVRRSAQ